MFFQEGASGFQSVSWDNGSGKGWAVPRCKRGGLTTGLCGWCQVSVVGGGREFPWSLRLPSQSGQLSCGQSSGVETGLTGSLAVWGVGTWTDPFRKEA